MTEVAGSDEAERVLQRLLIWAGLRRPIRVRGYSMGGFSVILLV